MQFFRPMVWLRTKGTARPGIWRPCANLVRRRYTGNRLPRYGKTRYPKRHLPSWTKNSSRMVAFQLRISPARAFPQIRRQATKKDSYLLQLRVLHLRLFQDGDVAV